MFYLYCYGLQDVNREFFWQWRVKYLGLFNRHDYNFWHQLKDTGLLLSWFAMPGWLLAGWAIYKRRLAIFKDKIIQVNLILALFLILFTLISGKDVDQIIFPIILPFVFVASLEIDSIRISIVSLFNWFSIFVFGTLGAAIWLLYIMLGLHQPEAIIHKLLGFSQNYSYHFKSWQLLLAIAITLIWLFLITRRHIRGREVVTNWASGTCFILFLFMCLLLPWFDSLLTFKPLVKSSLPYIDKSSCIVTNGSDTTQGALWYYYADVNLLPGLMKLDYNVCNQALVATEDKTLFDHSHWQVIWQGNRPIDKRVYYLLKHR